MDAAAAQRVVPRIEGFGPYRLGMTLQEAQAAHKGGKRQECGEIAPDRRCLALDAAVFEEPAVIYAVLDEAGARVERIVARMDPQLTRRRAYRCVRLSEKVFALLVVVYGSKYKQSYDQNRKPLPAVAWDGAEAGRLIFETRCKTPDEGNPRISVVEYYPDGVKPPPSARREPKRRDWPAQAPADPSLDATSASPDVPLSMEGQETAPQAGAVTPPNIPLATAGDEPPPPLSAPIGVVEELPPGTPDTAGAVDAEAMAALTRELEQAKGKVPAIAEAPAPAPLAEEAAGPPLPPDAASEPLPAPPTPDDSGGKPHAAGSHEVPVDVVPPAADAVEAQPDITLAPPQPLVAAVDPGPVTFTRPPPAAEEAAVAPATPAAEAVASEDAAPPSPAAPSTTAREAVAESVPPAAVDERAEPAPKAAPVTAPRADPEEAQTKAQPVPAPPRPAPRPVTSGPPFRPSAPAQLAFLPPPVKAPSYDAPGTPRDPTDLEAPEPFTVPEDEHVFRAAAKADVPSEAPAAEQPAESTPRPAVAAEPTLESEVRRRLANAPSPPAVEHAPLPAKPDPSESASSAPISLLSVARESAADDGAKPAKSPSGSQGRAASPPPPPTTPAGPETSRVGSEDGALSVARTADAVPPPAPEKPAPVTNAQRTPHSGEAAGAETASRETSAVLESPSPADWSMASEHQFTPVLSGGWRYRAPVPPAKPWRERADAPESAASGG